MFTIVGFRLVCGTTYIRSGILTALHVQLDAAKRQQADDLKRLRDMSYTPTSNFQDDDDAQEANTDFSLEGVANVGSELDRMTLQEKNKNMADRLQVGVQRNLDSYDKLV